MAACWPLTAFMLSDRYLSDLNEDNVLGTGNSRGCCFRCGALLSDTPSWALWLLTTFTGGKVVLEYASLMKQLWFGYDGVVYPTPLKRAVAKANEVFRGFAQHDASVRTPCCGVLCATLVDRYWPLLTLARPPPRVSLAGAVHVLVGCHPRRPEPCQEEGVCGARGTQQTKLLVVAIQPSIVNWWID